MIKSFKSPPPPRILSLPSLHPLPSLPNFFIHYSPLSSVSKVILPSSTSLTQTLLPLHHPYIPFPHFHYFPPLISHTSPTSLPIIQSYFPFHNRWLLALLSLSSFILTTPTTPPLYLHISSYFSYRPLISSTSHASPIVKFSTAHSFLLSAHFP